MFTCETNNLKHIYRVSLFVIYIINHLKSQINFPCGPKKKEKENFCYDFHQFFLYNFTMLFEILKIVHTKK